MTRESVPVNVALIAVLVADEGTVCVGTVYLSKPKRSQHLRKNTEIQTYVPSKADAAVS